MTKDEFSAKMDILVGKRNDIIKQISSLKNEYIEKGSLFQKGDRVITAQEEIGYISKITISDMSRTFDYEVVGEKRDGKPSTRKIEYYAKANDLKHHPK